jgi:peptidyl-prolyl cis-trans isomerase SurA
MKPNEISEVFETIYGYFILQLIQRRGDVVDARSLLIAPAIAPADLLNAKLALDTIYEYIHDNDTLPFATAAARYSNDEETRNNGGLILNPYSGSSRFQMDELGQMDQSIAFAIDKLKVGEMTKPMPFTTRDGKQAYQILYLKTRTTPHKMNLTDDYQKIQAMTLAKKQQEAIQAWVKRKVSNTFVRITNDYKACTFNNKWNNN